MSYFDLHKSYSSLENAFSKTKARFLVMAIPSDWLYATKESKKMVKVLISHHQKNPSLVEKAEVIGVEF